MHRCGSHIVGVTHTHHIGVGEVGKDNGILICAVALVAHREIFEIGMRIVLFVILGIPVHTCFSASLLQSAEGRCYRAVREQCVYVQQYSGAGKRHRYVAVIVYAGLEGLAPL